MLDQIGKGLKARTPSCGTFVAVMKPSKTRPRRDSSSPCDARSQFRCLLLKSPVGPILVVILNVGRKQPLQMRIVNGDRMVQQFAPATADPTLSDTVLPRTAAYRSHSPDVHGTDRSRHFGAVLGVVV